MVPVGRYLIRHMLDQSFRNLLISDEIRTIRAPNLGLGRGADVTGTQECRENLQVQDLKNFQLCMFEFFFVLF